MEPAHLPRLRGLRVNFRADSTLAPSFVDKFGPFLSGRNGGRSVVLEVVGEGGLEPPHPFGHRNLNPARLPIPPLARVTGQQYSLGWPPESGLRPRS